MVEQRAAREGQRGGLSLRLREVFSWARRYWLEVLGAGVVVLAPVGWWVLRSPDRRSADETVDEFFAAQRDGDCEQLVGLVTESSWSNGGRWSRDEFVDLGGVHVVESNLDISQLEGRLSAVVAGFGSVDTSVLEVVAIQLAVRRPRLFAEIAD